MNSFEAIVKVHDELHEAELLNVDDQEWVDGTPSREWSPSKNGSSFKGFPYYLIVNTDNNLAWVSDDVELMGCLQRV